MIRLRAFRRAGVVGGAGVLLGVCLAGCASHTLTVTDDAGKPVAGCRVTVGTLPPADLARLTGADGVVLLEDRYASPPRWIEVRKDGYVAAFIAFPTHWPATAVIREHRAPTTQPRLCPARQP